MGQRNAWYGFLAGAAAGLFLGNWWEEMEERRHHHPRPCPSPEKEPCPPPRVPDEFDEPQLAAALGMRLAGTSADGSLQQGETATSVVWVDGGDEVLVHLDSTQVRLLDRTLLVSVDLESDQTGRTPLVVAFALGDPNDPAGLVAVTDDLPRGHPLLAARWGHALQDAVWASLLGLAQDHADERAAAPRGLGLSPGRLRFKAGPPLSTVRAGGQ